MFPQYVNMSDTLNCLREHYGLTEDDLDKKVSDIHLDEISRNHCACWKLLPSYLELETIIVSDINQTISVETDRRIQFFRQWKKKKGFSATYRKLVVALLDVGQRLDAESVCKLLERSSQEVEHHDQPYTRSESASTDASCLPSAIDLTPYFPYLQAGSKVSEEEMSMLKERLYAETNTIKLKFASLMFDLQKDLEKSLQAEDIVNFLVFYNKDFETSLIDCSRHAQVFRKVIKFVSFFDYDLLECLIDKFGSDAIRKELEEYKDFFAEFSKRRVIECPSNAFGEREESEKVLAIIADKILEDLTLDELKKFKHKINKILGNKLVKVLSIEGGSIKLTFGILNKRFIVTKEQKQALQKEGVLNILSREQCIDLSSNFNVFHANAITRIGDFKGQCMIMLNNQAIVVLKDSVEIKKWRYLRIATFIFEVKRTIFGFDTGLRGASRPKYRFKINRDSLINFQYSLMEFSGFRFSATAWSEQHKPSLERARRASTGSMEVPLLFSESVKHSRSEGWLYNDPRKAGDDAIYMVPRVVLTPKRLVSGSGRISPTLVRMKA